ncbi:UbiH/UbiF family hydroxylase [Oricola cellulosilytica]|uniref:UbiH/UbiF family hydroxylase n=1 Tax=Oricola cellulosilytica TaxID=1429082 RepID=A0A4R0P818_9HYPH|nr:UbiH/UbiF family hydroxylase [Oricola cellulosilytica]TCD13179.1 UbiH/UbiF family hydroxylase [Oricola cellulosilytica]
MSLETDIVVTGAGPTALAAALEAASNGYDVILVAPTGTFTDDDHRTTALMMPAIEMLKDFGVWPSLSTSATALSTMRIIDASERLLRAPTVTFDAREIDADAFGYNIPNGALNQSLAAAVERTPAIRRIDAMASSASFDEGSATVALADGQNIRAKLAIAADGKHSVVRQAAGISVREWSYPQTAVVLTFAHARDHRNISTEFHTRTGPFTQVPMRGRRSGLVWVVKPEDADRIAGLDPTSIAEEIEHRLDSILGEVSDVSRPQKWPLSGMISDHFASRRLVLAGQAAHVFPPIGAQGLNLGMRDIMDLGRCLLDAGADPGAARVTDRYNRMRRLDVGTRTGIVDLLNRSLLTGFLPVQLGRSAGLGILAAVSPLRGLVMREGIEPGSGLRALIGEKGLRGRDRAKASHSSWRKAAP